MSEQKDRQTGFARCRQLHESVDVAQVLLEAFDVEAFAVGLAAAAQVEGVDREAVRDQLLGNPDVVAAMRVEAMDEHYDRTRRHVGPPGANEDP
jgi:hypothetical protein